jgi:hypothetical protein
MFYYILFVCTLYLGMFKFPDSYPGMIYDLLFLPLIIYSILSWKKSLKSDLVEKSLIFSWGFFVVYNVILLVSCEKSLSQITSILNIRLIYPYLLFYAIVVVIDTKKKLIKTVKYFLLLSFVASIFAIVQSIYGLEPMFNISGYYNVGHWSGQGNVMIGPIARVMLPTIYMIYIFFIALIIYVLLTAKTDFLPLISLFFIAIIISFTRSFWFATTITICLTVIISIRNKLIKKITFYISFIVLIIAISSIVIFTSLHNPVSISVSERLMSFFTDIQSNSGTYGQRLNSIARYIDIWQTKGVFFGVDPFFMDRFHEFWLSDVGFVYVLVTIGLIGFILLINIWILGIIFALVTLKKGVKTHKIELTLIGAVLFASIIFFIICQVYTQFSYTSSLFAIIFGLSVASKRIFTLDQ